MKTIVPIQPEVGYEYEVLAAQDRTEGWITGAVRERYQKYSKSTNAELENDNELRKSQRVSQYIEYMSSK
jgi:hypothetical protein